MQSTKGFPAGIDDQGSALTTLENRQVAAGEIRYEMYLDPLVKCADDFFDVLLNDWILVANIYGLHVPSFLEFRRQDGTFGPPMH